MKPILIVDDDELLLESLLRTFIASGEDWDVRTAANGRQALAIAAKMDAGIIVTDLMMPEKEGLETILELRKTRPDLPVIAMSGGSSRYGDHLQEAQLFGARYILRKPFEFEELVKCLRALDAEATEPRQSARP
jgi:DNA-binding response OmpR family regulator